MEKHSNNPQEINRRRFLKMVATLTAMAYIPSFRQEPKSDRWGPVLPKRKLGKTGLEVTMFTLGGGPYNFNAQAEDSIVEAAFKGGCRFFETARSYNRGESELSFGRVLEPYRNEIILSSKSGAFDADTLNRDINQSLKALKTSYLDIYLMHSVSSMDVLKRRFDGGVWDAMLKAKKEGKVRHLGFSGHADYIVNNYMLDMNLPDLEVMLMPINILDTIHNSFILNTLPKAVEKKIGVFAMKPLGGGAMVGADITWGKGVGKKRNKLIPDVISMEDAQHFVYSMPVSSVSFGCTTVEHVLENISHAKSFTAMDKNKQNSLIKKVTAITADGTYEHYKGSS